MTPNDEARIQMSVSDIVDVAMPDMEDEAKRRSEQLVAGPRRRRIGTWKPSYERCLGRRH